MSNETDTSSRCLLSLLVGSSIKWLVFSGILALLTTAQLLSPDFLSGYSFLTYGRVRAIQETVFVYGWGANAAFAIAIWILGRLSGAPLRGTGFATFGAVFWNLVVTGGLVAIALGEMTSIPFLQMPRYLHPVLLFAYAAIATPGILAWTGRRQRTTYAAQWYAVAALFLFPWLYSAGQVMLLSVPVRGVAHPVVAAWFAQNIQTCLLFTVAMAAAYYLVPKTTGRPVHHYEFAGHGFWTLVVFGTWIGPRLLVASPVPAWIPVISIVASHLLLFHYIVVILNLHLGMRAGGGDVVAKFVSAGLILYAVSGISNALFAFQGFAETLQYTYFSVALLKLGLYGGFSLIAFAAIYYLSPRITGVEWPSAGLVRAHYGLALAGVVLTVAGLAVAGAAQGRALLDATQTFATIASKSKPGLLISLAGEGLFLVGAVALAVNFLKLQLTACRAARTTETAALEVSTT